MVALVLTSLSGRLLSPPVSIARQTGFTQATSLDFSAEGPCEASNKEGYLFDDGQPPWRAKVIYTFSYCL